MANDWEAGLIFGCFGNCCLTLLTYLVFPLPYAQTVEHSGECSFIMALLVSFVPVLDCYYLAKARSNARERRNIAGTFLGDMLTSTLCAPCVIIQVRAEQQAHMSMGESIERC